LPDPRLAGILLDDYSFCDNLDMEENQTKEYGMPKGPRGESRPADVIGCAITVAKIATGEIEEELPEKSGRVRSAEAGGKARAKKLSKKRRSEIARLAAQARWGKDG